MIRYAAHGALSFVALLTASVASAQEFDESFDHWPVDLRIRGTLIVASDFDNTSSLVDALARSSSGKRISLFVDVAAGSSVDESPIVREYRAAFAGSKQTASDTNDGDTTASDGAKEDAAEEDDRDDNTTEDSRAVDVFATTKDFGEQLAAATANCDILCWHSTATVSATVSAESRAAFVGAGDALEKHVDAGRALLVVGPAARLVSRFFIDGSNEHPRVLAGLNLAPDCVVETNYSDAKNRGQLLAALATHPRSVGIGIEKNTAIVLAGRTIRVVGSGAATMLLMANERQPLRVQTFARRHSPRQPPQDYLADLTEWRRDAIDRTIDAFPPKHPRPPVVESGSLVIVGGGGMPRGLMRKFVDLAGGNEKAKLVYVPCAEGDDVGQRHGTIEQWRRMGVEHVAFVHTKDRNRANDDDEFLAPLRDATGIWFGGGRQWNFADSYYGTTAHRLMKEVLHRGGAIGGSSAGASIQARYLARATPIGNTRIMAPGYERGGLGFLSGVAIDQHFTQRGRQKDMTQLMLRHPQLLGIGLDEATAIVVRKSTAEVVGKGKVYFYDRRQPVHPDRPDYVALPAGEKFELVQRKSIEGESPAKDAD